jgi:CHAT domain-containing protein
MNPVNPMFSSLRLARGRGESPEDDGRLEVHELLAMRVASPLVFLSGCETALGGARRTPFDRGQDYATLAQAFLYAGALGVVATLWRIDDEGAAVFAERFYRAFQSKDAVDAVASAQRALIADPWWGHPYYWAGYTMAGDGPPAPGANRAEMSVSR